MRLPCKTKTEKAWLVVSLFILVAHRMFEVAPPSHYSPAYLLEVWLEVAMVVLSFPLGGLVMFVLRDAVFWCGGCRGLEWTLDWATLLFAGYIQWFWVLPEILRGRQLTLLNLRQPVEAVLPDATSSAPAPEVTQVAGASAASGSFTHLPAEFDEAGLTALGRVLQAQQTPQPVPAPTHAPRAELIFP
jgi:hypothetical protein